MTQFIFTIDKEAKHKDATSGKNVWSAVASTAAIDRDGEILLPKGCVADNFTKNPVMLYIHNYKQVPVGKVETLVISSEAVKFTFTFNDTADGQMLDGMYARGEMNAFSVGFAPVKSIWVDESTPSLLTIEYPDKTTEILDLSKYSKMPSRIFTQWELLEISPVPIPANPEALILRAKEELIRKAYDGLTNAGAKQLAADRIEHDAQQALALLKSFLQSAETDSNVDLNVIPYEKSEKTLDSEWDALGAKASLLKLATSLVEEKEVISWNIYSKGFAFVESKKADCVTSYKLLHHEVVDGEVCLSEKGLYQAVSKFLGEKTAYGDSAVEVYSHLKAHFDDLGKTAPEFEKEYSEEEIQQIAEKGFVEVINESTVLDNPSVTDTKVSEKVEEPNDLVKTVAALESKLTEFTELFGLKFRILSDTLDSVHASVKSLKAVETKNEGDTLPSEQEQEEIKQAEVEAEVEKQLSLLKDNLKEFLGENKA